MTRENLSEKFFKEKTDRERGVREIDDIPDIFKRRGIYRAEKEKLEQPSFPPELENGIAAYLASREDSAVLDIGAGEGNFSVELSEVSHAFALDLYPPQRTKRTKGVSWIQADLDQPHIPARSESFDLTVAQYVTKYVEDPIKLLNEVIRVTRPNGFIILNGIKSFHLAVKYGDLTDEEHFFQDKLKIPTDKLVVLVNRFLFPDWVIVKVLDPSYQLDVTLDNSRSTTIVNVEKPWKEKIGDAAHFVYKKDRRGNNPE